MSDKRRDAALLDVECELIRAQKKFAPQRGPHEGYAVILEELDELWAEVKANAPLATLRAEAVQVAAMATRFVIDVCDASLDEPERGAATHGEPGQMLFGRAFAFHPDDLVWSDSAYKHVDRARDQAIRERDRLAAQLAQVRAVLGPPGAGEAE